MFHQEASVETIKLIMTSCRSGTIVCNRLQLYLDALKDWADKWKIVINPGKSEAVWFTTRRVTPSQQVRFKGTAISWGQRMKYLGLILDKMTWPAHITYVANKGNAMGSLLRSLVGIYSTSTWGIRGCNTEPWLPRRCCMEPQPGATRQISHQEDSGGSK